MPAHVMLMVLVAGLAGTVVAEDKLETDILPSSGGELKITFIGHGTLMFTFS